MSCFFTTKKKNFFSFLLPFIVVVVVQWFKLKFDFFFFSFSFWKVTTNDQQFFIGCWVITSIRKKKKSHHISKLLCLCHSVCMPVYQCEKDHCHNPLFINMMIMDYQWIRKKIMLMGKWIFFSFFLPQKLLLLLPKGQSWPKKTKTKIKTMVIYNLQEKNG